MPKLTVAQRKKLMMSLCQSLCTLKQPEEVAEFLLDFLSPKENETIAKRLRIAELLAKNYNYEEIRTEVGVGFSTIARVNTWLNLSGKGFKMVLERKKKEAEYNHEADFADKYDPYSWGNARRRYSMYFWPQLLIEELLKRSNKEEKKKILNVFDLLALKRKTFTNEQNKMLYNNFSNHFKKLKEN